ncbi:hypothetical protein HGT73_01460 [Rosenbergiella australiborealis]|uniref:Uncharacterized protein n=1 Tax=Rosenbergiella australiborealis TaxID=1544696 RepID=A0ABS5T151_9GAMM|nr:hypothetical protein [Rosenbergiella australiborealis]MBT0726056.1 hypothetical protein [Rosenbergiella australiborealis]
MIPKLSREAFIKSSRRKTNRIGLTRLVKQNNIGDVLGTLKSRQQVDSDLCLITSSCHLSRVLSKAMNKFIAKRVSDTLVDIAGGWNLKRIFNVENTVENLF